MLATTGGVEPHSTPPRWASAKRQPIHGQPPQHLAAVTTTAGTAAAASTGTGGLAAAASAALARTLLATFAVWAAAMAVAHRTYPRSARFRTPQLLQQLVTCRRFRHRCWHLVSARSCMSGWRGRSTTTKAFKLPAATLQSNVVDILCLYSHLASRVPPHIPVPSSTV